MRIITCRERNSISGLQRASPGKRRNNLAEQSLIGPPTRSTPSHPPAYLFIHMYSADNRFCNIHIGLAQREHES
jgi:hypothetical protein